MAIFILLFSFTPVLQAQTKAGIDLEAVMKQMRFEYTQAMKSETTEKFNRHLQAFKHQLKIAQKFPFSKQRIEKATQGLNKVAAVAAKVKSLTSIQQLLPAKKTLYLIDDLRKEYHDKKPSLWQRFYEIFFGADENSPKLILLEE